MPVAALVLAMLQALQAPTTVRECLVNQIILDFDERDDRIVDADRRNIDYFVNVDARSTNLGPVSINAWIEYRNGIPDQSVAWRRAQAVRAYLLRRGIDPTRIDMTFTDAEARRSIIWLDYSPTNPVSVST